MLGGGGAGTNCCDRGDAVAVVLLSADARYDSLHMRASEATVRDLPRAVLACCVRKHDDCKCAPPASNFIYAAVSGAWIRA